MLYNKYNGKSVAQITNNVIWPSAIINPSTNFLILEPQFLATSFHMSTICAYSNIAARNVSTQYQS